MSAEVEWVLATIAANWAGYGDEEYGGYYGDLSLEEADIVRVNRDTSDQLEGDIRARSGDLQDAVFVGATFAGQSNDPVGTEYSHRVEATVGVRIEGLHVDQYGLVDPSGEEADTWQSIVNAAKDALLRERSYPDVPDARPAYKDLLITNEAPQSSQHRDYFRHDFDVVLRGYDDLP